MDTGIQSRDEAGLILPLFYMGVARASGQDLSPTTLQEYSNFYTAIPDLGLRISRLNIPVMFYRIIGKATDKLLPKIDELEKRWKKGEWKTVREFYKWVYPEKELTAIDLANRFHNNFSTWRANVDDFIGMNLRDLDETDTEALLTDIGIQAFETLPRMAKKIIEETGAKPDERIMRLVKLSK